jgi:aminoglycoside phosphotransferase (APT) family kinase protein
MAWSKPETAQIREALRRYAPQLADSPIEFMAEGWEFWAYRAGDFVLRFPKAKRGFVWKLGNQSSAMSLQIEQSLTPLLAETLPVQISVTEVYGESGPNNAPFAGHRFLPGEVVMCASARPAPDFGRDLGRMIAELHGFPPATAIETGVPIYDGPRLRDDRGAHYEAVIHHVFPVVSCQARTHVERVYEAYLNDDANFQFEPVLAHNDLAVNTLVDAAGNLCGLIDFADAAVSSPALDFWLPVFGFDQLGIAGQRAACIEAAGIDDRALARMTPELTFLHVRYSVLGILHGLLTGDDQCAADSIQELNAVLPLDLRCD